MNHLNCIVYHSRKWLRVHFWKENCSKKWHLLIHRFVVSYAYFKNIAWFWWQMHFLTVAAKTTAQQRGNELCIWFFACVIIRVSFLPPRSCACAKPLKIMVLKKMFQQLRLKNFCFCCKIKLTFPALSSSLSHTK